MSIKENIEKSDGKTNIQYNTENKYIARFLCK